MGKKKNKKKCWGPEKGEAMTREYHRDPTGGHPVKATKGGN